MVEIKVENRGRYLDRISYGKVRLQPDGSFLANNFHQVFHWNEHGDLITSMGGRGEGPGEFQAISEVLFIDGYYWVVDGARMESAIFDNTGHFLYRKPINCRQFLQTEDQVFLVDNSAYNPYSKNYPTVIQEIQFKIDQDNLEIHTTPLRFKKISEMQRNLRMNFKLFWISRQGDRYFLMDQLEPKIRIYDKAAREKERQSSIDEPFEPNSLALNLKYWVHPPEKMAEGFESNKQMLRWWQSWSRINYFGDAGDGFFVAYETPDPEDAQNNLQVIQRLDLTGQRMGQPLVLEGLCMGVRNNLVYIFNADDETDNFNYYIKGYEF